MKKTLRLVSLMIVLTLVLASVSILAVGAEESEGGLAPIQNKVQKVVTVVYDDSGSMGQNVNVPNDYQTKPSRADYALYAMKMLMSLLGEGDLLQIVPMNGIGREYTLVGDGRQGQIDKIVATNMFNANGSNTPIKSIDNALEELKKAGLKDSQNITTQDENKEFWLFILTDGQFDNGYSTISKKNTAPEINKRIGDYPGLKTIYFAFSSAATDLRGTAFESETRTAYIAKDGTELVKGMQAIAGQLSGRYDYTDYSVSGDTVTVNLGNSNFAIKNLSVIALNSGATITSVKYKENGSTTFKDLPAGSVTQTCVIGADNIPNVQPGFSAIINGSPSFAGGTLTIKFSKNIPKDFFSIFAEPELILSPTFRVDDGNGQLMSVDSSYIAGGKVSAGDKLMVGYQCTSGNGTPIDIAKAFNSTVKATVTYNNISKEIPGGKGETDITLVQGPGTITVTVNIEGVNYKMYTTVNCNILADQSSYKVVAEHARDEFNAVGSATVKYKIFVDNAEKSLSYLKSEGFTWYVEVTTPGGDVKRVDNPEIGGEIAYKIEAEPGDYGNYKVYFRVTSSLGWRPDEATYSYSVSEDSVEIRTTSPETVNKGASEWHAQFTVHTGDLQIGKRMLEGCDINIKLTSYDGTESELDYIIDNDGTIVSTVPFNPDVYGEYKVYISVELASANVTADYTHVFKVYPHAVNITGEHPDAFASGETKTTAKYWIKMDGVQLTKAQLEKYQWSLKTYLPGEEEEYPNKVTVDDDGTIHLEYDVAGSKYGAYASNLLIYISENYCENYKNYVKNYPTDLLLTVVGGGKLSVSQHEMTSNDKSVQFELFSGGMPLVFNNGITDYKVLVGSTDVTKFATVTGNVLSYAPHADHFGGALPTGDYTVTVSISSDDVTGLTASASTDFSVTQTYYEVISLTDTNKKVERFSLGDVDAVIHFQILRDGIALPLDELNAAMEAGEIKIADTKGTFTWEFWLPTGREISIKEVNGRAVIEFRVTRDIGILALDKVMGMFFFTGDKPITLTYNGVTGTDAIYIQRGAWWVYIIIWLILALITHLIFFTVGFFNGRCKNLPTGAFTVVSLAGGSGTLQTFAVSPKVNYKFKDKWLWHWKRLALIGWFENKKYWYHQPGIRIASFNATLSYDDNGTLQLIFRGTGIVPPSVSSTSVKSEYTEFIGKLAAYNGKGRAPTLKLRVGDLRDLFVLDGKPAIVPNSQNTDYSREYAKVDSKDNITSVIRFVEK